MSDGFPFGSFGVPLNPDDPDVQAAMIRQKQAQDNAEIKSMEFKENFSKLLKNASREDLSVLSDIFASIAATPVRAPFYLGLIHATSMMKFDTCPMCNEDHAAELHKGVEDELKRALTNEGENIPGTLEWTDPDFLEKDGVVAEQLETTVDQMAGSSFTQPTFAQQRVWDFDFDPDHVTDEEMEEIRRLAFVPPTTPLSAETQAKATEWGLDDAWEESSEPGGKMFKGWICTRCKNHYHSSIQDRMLKPNDVTGCPGCIQKQKWG